MTKQFAIEKLDELKKRITEKERAVEAAKGTCANQPDFDLLIKDIVGALNNIFPADKKEYVAELKRIRFAPNRQKWPKPDANEPYITCRDGLHQVRIFLTSLIGTVEQYWKEEQQLKQS